MNIDKRVYGENAENNLSKPAMILSIALIIVGYFLYKESFSVTKAAGIGMCLFGLFLINK